MINATSLLKRLSTYISGLIARFNTPNGCTGIAITVSSIFLITASKGFRHHGGYPLIHWFFNYSVGFIKRGFVGTIVRPLFDFKPVHDIRACIEAISFLVFFLAITLITLSIRRVLITHLDREGKLSPITIVSMLVVATAPAAVLAGNSVTFFDLFLAVYCMLSIFAIQANRFIIPMLLSMMGVATHEIYFLYGYPVVLMSLLTRLFYDESHRSKLAKGIYMGVNVLFPLLVFLLIGLTQATTNDQMIQALSKLVAEYKVFDDQGIQQGLFPISHSALHYLAHPPKFLDFLSDIKIVTTTYVATLYLIIALFTLFASKKQKLLMVFLPLVIIAPLFLGVIAWDTHRFAAFTTMQAFYAFLVLRERLTSPKPWVVILVVTLGLGVVVNNLSRDVWFFHSRLNENGATALRSAPPINVFPSCHELFPNSTFEKGTPENWTVQGNAFVFQFTQTEEERNALIKKQLGPQDRWWLRGTSTHGGSPTGSVTSAPFTIQREQLMFMVMGKESPSDLFVSVSVDGKEILRATGSDPDRFQTYMFDVSRYKGKQATIYIIDNNSQEDGRISVDGFCYSPLIKGGTPAR